MSLRNDLLDGSPDLPTGIVKFFFGGRGVVLHSATYKENVASTCKNGKTDWDGMVSGVKLCIRLACTLAPSGKYG